MKKLARCIGFLLCAVLLLCGLTAALERKTYTGAWNYMSKLEEFYALPENSLDYLCLGSSHMYCTVNPLEVWKESGLRGFVLATQQQPIKASRRYLLEALKTQQPKVVFLEAMMLCTANTNDAALRSATDPLRFSANKLQLIGELAPEENRASYYWNLIKYHARWKQWSAEELSELVRHEVDIYKGFVALAADRPTENRVPDYTRVLPVLPNENLYLLQELLSLTQAHGAQLVLVIAPFDTEKTEHLSAMKAALQWAKRQKVDCIDYTALFDRLEIDAARDYYDDNHFDVSGARKCSVYLSQYLRGKGLSANRQPIDEGYQRDYEQYRKNFTAQLP